MEEISRQDLTENVVMIRINKAYHDGMSANGLHYRGVLQHFLKMVFIPKCNVISQKLQVKTE